MYYGMKRCRFCEHAANCRAVRIWRDPNHTCEEFTSGGVLPEIAVDMEVGE